MICEMCGKNVPSTRPVFIDGARLSVCPNCVKFADESKGGRSGSPGASPTVIEQRLEKRNRRMQSKNLYDGNDNVHIVDGYGEIIKKARSSRGMDLKQFAESIGEKQGLLAFQRPGRCFGVNTLRQSPRRGCRCVIRRFLSRCAAEYR